MSHAVCYSFLGNLCEFFPTWYVCIGILQTGRIFPQTFDTILLRKYASHSIRALFFIIHGPHSGFISISYGGCFTYWANVKFIPSRTHGRIPFFGPFLWYLKWMLYRYKTENQFPFIFSTDALPPVHTLCIDCVLCFRQYVELH